MTDDELKEIFAALRSDLEAANQSAARTSQEEIRRHFDTVAEGLEKKIDTLAELIGTVNEKVERRMESFETAASAPLTIADFNLAGSDSHPRGWAGCDRP